MQPKNVDDLTNGGNVEDEKLSVHLSKNYRRLGKCMYNVCGEFTMAIIDNIMHTKC